MADYRKALWDDSEPLYAPGLNWSGKYPYWKPTKAMKENGCPAKPVPLTGTKGDGRDAERAQEARKLTRKALDTYQPTEGPARGTWAWVIEQWKADMHSAYNTCGGAQRESYDYVSGKWEAAIGHMKIVQLTYQDISASLTTMREKKYSASVIKKMFSFLGQVSRYALGPLRQTDARVVVDTLAFIRLKGGKRREVFMTAQQVRMIIDEADKRGLFAYATGILFTWTYALRAVDVRGQWFPTEEDAGGIIRNGKRWQDGLTWDMFDTDLTKFSKIISKTKTPMNDVRLTPELSARLRLLKTASGVGPVFTSERYGEPYTRNSWSQRFREIRDHLKLPKEFTVMDIRASALTEAKNLGIDPYALRDAAQHRNVDMTDRYTRDMSENINKVVELRGRK